MMSTWEEREKKSFDYQAELYLNRLKEKFQKEFLNKNYYIDLNGEIRKEIKRKDAEIDSQRELKAGVHYEPVVYEPLDKFIHEWLRDENANFLVILGEYGTGKTTFLRHLAHQLAAYRLEPGTGENAPDDMFRLPLLFPLRDFEKKMEPFIVD